MSSLLVRLEYEGDGRPAGKVTLEGVVIGCRQTGPATFEITVFFEFPPADEARVAPELPPSWN